MYARFKYNICAADLAETGSLPTKNLGVKYLLYFIDVLTKYALVKVLRDTTVKTILNDIIGTVNESKRKPNKLCVGQGRDFYNNLIKNNLDTNDILM